MSRVSRPLLAATLLLALAGCAPDAGAATQHVEIEGVITPVAASASSHGYMLDVADHGFLALDLGDLQPPTLASGVVVEVPASLEIPADVAGRFATLSDYSADSGQPLQVVAFLP